MSVRNGSQLTGVPWDLRLAGHTSATHTFLVFSYISMKKISKGCIFSLRGTGGFFRCMADSVPPKFGNSALPIMLKSVHY